MRLHLKVLLAIFLLFIPVTLISHINVIIDVYFDIILDQLFNTGVIALSVVSLSVLVGGVSAWVIALKDFPLKRQIEVLLILGMVFPSYVLAFLYSDMFWFGGNISTILTLTVATLPYVFMIVTMGIRSQSQQLVYTALMLGKDDSWIKTKVLFPLLKPALIMSALLVIGDTVSEFGATHFYGVSTVMTGIYEIWFGLHEIGQGITFSAYVFVSLGIIYYFVNVWKRSFIGVQPRLQNDDSNQNLIPENTGKKGWWITASFIPLITITFFIPLLTLFKWVYLSFGKTDWLKVIYTTFNSSILATTISVLVIAITSGMLYLFKKRMAFVTTITNTLYGTPGIVLSIAAITVVGYVGTWAIPLFFIYILVLKFLALGTDSVGVGIQKINRQYYHTSKTLGKTSPWYVWKVQIPLSIQSYIVAGILVWIDVIRELVISMTLRPQWLELLSVEIFRYMDLEKLSMSGPWILAMVLVTIVPIYWINIVIKAHNK